MKMISIFPKADILSKIADVLDTTTDYLLCRTNNSAPLSKNNQIKFLDDYHFKIYNIADELNLANKIRLLERANTLLDLQKEQNKNQINPLKKRSISIHAYWSLNLFSEIKLL